jgi:RNA polymerase sigma factor (sigma-70 family)
LTSLATARGPARPREDSEAERLYSEYSERIFASCLRRLGSRSEAEDAVQITFLYALRALRHGVVPDCELAWLHTIARNVCRWQQRTASRRPLPGERGLEHVASPERNEDHELLAGLNDALESLPERQRIALLLREWRGLSTDEIAHHLQLSAPATHALLTRARHALAQALTAPRRAALGLATAAYELRSWIKAALGGASAKAAVATIAVVGAGAGAVAVDRGFAEDEGARAPLVRSPERAAGSSLGDASGSSASARASAVVERIQRPRTVGAKSGRLSPAPAITPTGRERAFVTSPPRRDDDRPSEPPSQPDVVAPTPLLPELVPPSLELPSPPTGDLLPVDLPPVDVPPVDVPPIDLPTDLVPPVDVPPVDVPPVDVPTVDVPQVEPPPVEAPPPIRPLPLP